MGLENETVLKQLLEDGKRLRETNMEENEITGSAIMGQEYTTWRQKCKIFLGHNYPDSDFTKEFASHAECRGWPMTDYENMIGVLESILFNQQCGGLKPKENKASDAKEKNERYSDINVSGSGNTFILGGIGHTQSVDSRVEQPSAFEEARSVIESELSGPQKEELMRLVQEMEENVEDKPAFMDRFVNFTMKVGALGGKLEPVIDKLKGMFV